MLALPYQPGWSPYSLTQDPCCFYSPTLCHFHGPKCPFFYSAYKYHISSLSLYQHLLTLTFSNKVTTKNCFLFCVLWADTCHELHFSTWQYLFRTWSLSCCLLYVVDRWIPFTGEVSDFRVDSWVISESAVVAALALEDVPQGSRYRETVRRLRMEPSKGSEEDQSWRKFMKEVKASQWKKNQGEGMEWQKNVSGFPLHWKC